MDTAAVIGAGTMGAGIAQLAAAHGWNVRLVDVHADALDRALAGIRERLDRMVTKGHLSHARRDETLARISTSSDMGALHDAHAVIEAVPEDLTLKHRIFTSLERAVGPDALLATNTSSLSVSRIAQGLRASGRVVGMHFFNPAPVMLLVEIIAAEKSEPSFVARAVQTAKAWGKTPVVAKDTPGFIVNRVARGFYLEALRLLGEGIAGVDEIDRLMRSAGGFRMGPFELMDLVGLDVNLAVSTSVWEQMGSPARLAPHPIQQRLVEQGRFGRKSGAGFYQYDGPAPMPAYPVDRRSFQRTPLLADALRAFCYRAGATGLGSTEQYVFGRILGAILNESAFALEEEVATAGDIDVAMTKGTNYPKGPIEWSRQIGHRTVRGALKAINELCEDGRFAPAKRFST